MWPAEENQPWLAACLRSCAVGLRDAAGDALWAVGSCHPVLVRAGRSMDDARLTGPAVAYWRELAATSDRIVGPSSPDTLMAGSKLADALMAAGQAAEAVAWAQWVVAGRTRVLGSNEPSTIAARTPSEHATNSRPRAAPREGPTTRSGCTDARWPTTSGSRDRGIPTP
jgi:hypothetical protein